mgnify:CR=1 FL=1
MAELEVDDGTLWYEETGSGPPLVFVHGGWMDGDAWEPQVERFADGHRVVTMDLRGHGRTGAIEPRRYSVDLFADDLERLVDHLALDDAVVCGLSLGNFVTQAFVDRHPDRLRAAVLGGPARSIPPVDLPKWLKVAGNPEAGVRASLQLSGTKGTFRSMLTSVRAATGRPWLSVDQETRAQAIESVGSISRSEYRKIFGALYRYEPPALSHVSTPTLAIYGEAESPFVKRQGRQIAAAVEEGTVRSIPDAAHLVNVDNPTAFNDAVSQFIDSANAAS